MPYVHLDTDVLNDFDTEDLIEELESRGHTVLKDVDYDSDANEIVRHIFEKRRVGKDYQHEIDVLIYNVLGRIA